MMTSMLSALAMLPALAGAEADDDPRETRDDFSLAVGPLLRTDRGTYAILQSGLAAEAEAPIAWRFNLRLDFMTGHTTRDDLRVSGPKLAAMAVYHQPIDIFAVDIGVGPGAWFGPSAWWNKSYPGPWPGWRAAVGGSYRPHPWVGARIDFGVDQHFGTYPLVNGSSTGWDLRLMLVGWVP